jgi:hypothetical protein
MGIGHALDVASFVGIMMDWAKLFSFWFMMIYIVMSFVPMYINICNISPLHPVIYDISPQAISIYIYIYIIMAASKLAFCRRKDFRGLSHV